MWKIINFVVFLLAFAIASTCTDIKEEVLYLFVSGISYMYVVKAENDKE